MATTARLKLGRRKRLHNGTVVTKDYGIVLKALCAVREERFAPEPMKERIND